MTVNILATLADLDRTVKEAVEYQNIAADFAADAAYLIEEGAIRAAIDAQQHAAEYADVARTRLARLIGVEAKALVALKELVADLDDLSDEQLASIPAATLCRARQVIANG